MKYKVQSTAKYLMTYTKKNKVISLCHIGESQFAHAKDRGVRFEALTML